MSDFVKACKEAIKANNIQFCQDREHVGLMSSHQPGIFWVPLKESTHKCQLCENTAKVKGQGMSLYRCKDCQFK